MGLVDPGKRREYWRQWQRENPMRCSEYRESYVKKHPKRVLITQARSRAKKNGIEFTITENDFDLPEFCPALGIRLEFNIGRGAGGMTNSYSLDRIDSKKGYVPGNVRVLSRAANMMKGAATEEQLKQFAKWVLG